MKWAIIVNGEIEIRECEEEIKGMVLGSYYELIEYISMGNNLENGTIRVTEGITVIENEDIDLVEFRDI